MLEFEKRLIEEEDVLSSKVRGLSDFIWKSDGFLKLDGLQQDLLNKQLDSMVSYLSILRSRMVSLGIYKK